VRRGLLGAVFLIVGALFPAAAAADFHLVSIREVFPGEATAPDAEYVELQAYAAGQQFVSGHSVTFHDASGATIGTEPFADDVADGRNQMTVLMATPAAEARFGVVADEPMGTGLIDLLGGAVCWSSLDCVAWGSFSGSLPSAAGPPAASPGGIPDGMALRRTIAAGCATLLEAADDTNDSALDFAAVFPGPRPNSVVPSEQACVASGPQQGGGAQQGGGTRGAPQTSIRRRPPQRSRDRTPTFRFRADEAGSSFECKLDRRPFRRCRSPFTSRWLAPGLHTFRVRARDRSGQVDPSPAFDSFRIRR